MLINQWLDCSIVALRLLLHCSIVARGDDYYIVPLCVTVDYGLWTKKYYQLLTKKLPTKESLYFAATTLLAYPGQSTANAPTSPFRDDLTPAKIHIHCLVSSEEHDLEHFA